MDFSLSDEQRALADLAGKILGDACTLERLKTVEHSEARCDRELWAELAKAGLIGAALPESVGGSGFVDACLLLEQQGRRVAMLPLLSAAVSAAMPLARFGSREQQQRWLPDVVNGKSVLSAALTELGSDSEAPATTATADGGGW